MARRTPLWRPEYVDDLAQETAGIFRGLIEQFEETTYTFARLGRDLANRMYNRNLRDLGDDFEEYIEEQIEDHNEQMNVIQAEVEFLVNTATDKVRRSAQRTDVLEEDLRQAQTERDEWRARAEKAEQRLRQEREMGRRTKLLREVMKLAGKSRTLQGMNLIRMEMRK